MRYDDWPSRLHGYVESQQDAKFAYGRFDCGLFAAGCIEAMTGEDFASDLRGYTSGCQAREVCKRLCGSASIPNLAEYIAARHNLKAVPILHAQRGDLAIVKDRRFGIVALNGTEVMVPGRIGVLRFPLTDATKVYRI
ncbi:DUF6950 family protein [Acidicapsa acidisoli]|uniref:DUF6950 family protein n=1 Tax=Acidicapsa acidisoli TaxID=1615681 RepID=UPI0021E0C44B|nr:hypothetical protein [Acidicapsa acidisoli]